MKLSYDMNGNILTLQRNGNDNNHLVMDNFNYKYYSLSNGTPQNIQLTGFNFSC
jgi:hypothetical protein